MKTLSLLLFLILTFSLVAQNAPSHLKYFGYVAIDCFYDDPLDNSNLNNYISEVDSFSNIAHMCVFSPTDDITTRVNNMNNHCVKPLIHFQSIFYEYVDTNGLGGENYDLIPDFTSRWNTFKNINASILDTSNIAAFYIVDEPFWKGVTFAELDTVCSLIKASFPNIPLMIVEASGALSALQVPSTIDWLAFDHYGIFDPSSNTSFLSNLALLKSKKSDPNQAIFLIIDDQWLPLYGAYGYQPDTIAYMVQNYYNLAVSDTDIVGLIGYLWPGGLDDPAHLGVRNLPQNVIDKNIEIGQKIIPNYSPCDFSNIDENILTKKSFVLYPNPSNSVVHIKLNLIDNTNLSYSIFDNLGRKVHSKQAITENTSIPINNLTKGFYSFILFANNEIVGIKKLIIN